MVTTTFDGWDLTSLILLGLYALTFCASVCCGIWTWKERGRVDFAERSPVLLILFVAFLGSYAFWMGLGIVVEEVPCQVIGILSYIHLACLSWVHLGRTLRHVFQVEIKCRLLEHYKETKVSHIESLTIPQHDGDEEDGENNITTTAAAAGTTTTTTLDTTRQSSTDINFRDSDSSASARSSAHFRDSISTTTTNDILSAPTTATAVYQYSSCASADVSSSALPSSSHPTASVSLPGGLGANGGAAAYASSSSSVPSGASVEVLSAPLFDTDSGLIIQVPSALMAQHGASVALQRTGACFLRRRACLRPRTALVRNVTERGVTWILYNVAYSGAVVPCILMYWTITSAHSILLVC